MTELRFSKMHGLGNDFVIIDLRRHFITLSPQVIERLADRHTGIGCDQLVTLQTATEDNADILVRFYNQDGSQSGACGNATRCVADMMMTEKDITEVVLQTQSGLITCHRVGQMIEADMGVANFEWQQIPLAKEKDVRHICLAGLRDGTALSMGNPHVVFFVPNLTDYDLAVVGPVIEHDALFPERVNVGLAQIIKPNVIKLLVWERGAGITQACGSGACAAAMAAFDKGLVARNVTIELPGGTLTIRIDQQNHLWMTGPVSYVYQGMTQLETFQ